MVVEILVAPRVVIDWFIGYVLGRLVIGCLSTCLRGIGPNVVGYTYV